MLPRRPKTVDLAPPVLLWVLFFTVAPPVLAFFRVILNARNLPTSSVRGYLFVGLGCFWLRFLVEILGCDSLSFIAGLRCLLLLRDITARVYGQTYIS